MTCSGCARHATEVLQQVPGVARAEVRLAENRATVEWAAAGTPRHIFAIAPDRLLALSGAEPAAFTVAG